MILKASVAFYKTNPRKTCGNHSSARKEWKYVGTLALQMNGRDLEYYHGRESHSCGALLVAHAGRNASHGSRPHRQLASIVSYRMLKLGDSVGFPVIGTEGVNK